MAAATTVGAQDAVDRAIDNFVGAAARRIGSRKRLDNQNRKKLLFVHIEITEMGIFVVQEWEMYLWLFCPI